MGTYGIKLIASNALKNKYGFGPDPDRITLLESDGEGTYILFRVGDHEYRFVDGELINLEDQKKLDNESEFHAEMIQSYHKNLDELKKTLHYRELALDQAAEKRDELETKNRQLCNDLARERWTVQILKEKLEESQKLADQLKAERDEFIKSWLSAKDALDERIRNMKK